MVVAVAAAAAVLLFEFSAAAVGLLGFVPLAIGLHGLAVLRHRLPRQSTDDELAGRRAGARPPSVPWGAVSRPRPLVTIAAGGDNLAVYIPLFREGGAVNLAAIAIVFVAR